MEVTVRRLRRRVCHADFSCLTVPFESRMGAQVIWKRFRSPGNDPFEDGQDAAHSDMEHVHHDRPEGLRWSSVERCQGTLVRLQHRRYLFAKEVDKSTNLCVKETP